MPADKLEQVYDGIHSKPIEQSKWWRVLRKSEGLMKFLRDNPGEVVFGENFGHVQKLRYGHGPNEISFAAFDIMKDGRWLDHHEFYDKTWNYQIPTAPLVNPPQVPYDFDTICALAEGPSLWPGAVCIREGIVLSPLKNRWHTKIGRVKLKVVSATYLEKFR